MYWKGVLHDGVIPALEGNAYLKSRAAFIYSVIHEQDGRLQLGITWETCYQQIMREQNIRFTRLFIHIQTLEQAPFPGDICLIKEMLNLSIANVPYIQRHDTKPNDSYHQVSKTEAVYSITKAG